MSQALIAGALDCATQGVLPIAQGMDKNTLSVYIVGAACRRKAGQLLGLLGREGRLADQDGRRPEGQDRRHLDHRRRNARAVQPDAQARTALDPEKDIKLVEVSFSLSEDALRAGRVDSTNMNQPFAARAEAKGGVRKLFSLDQALPNIVHIVEACRKDFVDKNPDLVRNYVKDITAALKMALANRAETMQVVSEITKAPIAVLDTYLLKQNDFAREPGARAELRRHPGDVRRLYGGEDDREEARREHAEASDDRRAD